MNPAKYMSVRFAHLGRDPGKAGQNTMRFGINLRGDLRKLDDAELASRYDSLVAEKVARLEAMPQSSRSKGADRFTRLFFNRGPLHARICYRMLAIAQSVVALFEGSGIPLTNEIYRAYLAECELKDVTDEIKYRIRRRAKYQKPMSVTR